MKIKILLSIISIGFILNIYCQKATIELTFTAINTSQYVPLDSVYVQNLTQGRDTTIYAPESSLVINNVGIADNDGEKYHLSLSQNYPNPIITQTSINLILPEQDYITICVQNMLGQELTFYESNLPEGNHTFTFFPGHEDIYILTAFSSRGGESIKMVNLNKSGSNKCRIVHMGYNNTQITAKSIQSNGSFLFSFGDELRYTGYAKTLTQVNGSDILEDAPQMDETYQFKISEGFPCREEPYFTYEGQQYNTVQIGDQCWMKENLNLGIKIGGQYEQSNNGLIEKYCYNDDDNVCYYYGGLYQWDELMEYTTSEGAQGICPDGWLLPTDDDFSILANYLGGATVAGGKLKEYGLANWTAPNTGATNASGFTGLPGGHRNTSGEFWNNAYTGNFWTSTENSGINARRWYLDTGTDDFDNVEYNKNYAYSVRCIKAKPHIWSCGDTIHDSRDDKIYHTVRIGDQCWMNENLNTGSRIESQYSQEDNELTEKYCYNNEESNCTDFGGLYQWNEMMNHTTVNDSNGICPSGWYLPSDEDIKILEGVVDSQYPVGSPEWENFNSRGYDAGYNLKSSSGWYQGGNGSDLYGFACKPGGYLQFSDGSFFSLLSSGYFWTTTEANNGSAFFREFYYNGDRVNRHSTNKQNAFSVRCLKNIPAWQCGDPIHDSRNDKVYNTVEIGAKCWMAENLNVGTMINGENEMTNNSVIEKYCYDDNEENCDLLGAYYSWKELMNYSSSQGAKGICPDGWHVPTDIEWCMTTIDVDPTVNCQMMGEYSGTDAGIKMKTTSGWGDEGNGSNISGFSAYPSGFRDIGHFSGWGTYALIWSSTETDDNSALLRGFSKSEDGVMRANLALFAGLSARCVKD